ncbi:MAG: glucose-1-phosphate cytidylyltransferase [Gammaproteobacteria bacterium]|mgnify:CR=1 FL=1|nr:glucose-1-phosphate cytidylyltransferase [Gammaproteobacteria bacterium]HXK57898.1 sugar phosphate nucleotidyltransferase [Gammaproteobacteria bacterium]
MKVVLFCGGLGTRLREHTETVPKPMVNIGQRPILWHLMKYYAHFGHCEFILCLGYMGDLIKQYFINYAEWISNDFRLSGGGNEVHLFNRDIADWKITFADTGTNSNIGQRLMAVRRYLGDDAVFLANYSDGLSDLPLVDYLDNFRRRDKIASFISVRPTHSFHTVAAGADQLVHEIRHAGKSDIRINGGFFAFKREIFDYLQPGEDLVEEPFRRLIAGRQLLAYPHEGFWACMDTLKDKKAFDEMEMQGDMPWQLWHAR